MERQVCYFQIVSAEGFTPSACVLLNFLREENHTG